MTESPLGVLVHNLRNYEKLNEEQRQQSAMEAADVISDLTQSPLVSGTYTRQVEGLAEIMVGGARYYVRTPKKIKLSPGDELAIHGQSYAILGNLGQRYTGPTGEVSELLKGHRAIVTIGQNTHTVYYNPRQEIDRGSRVSLDPSQSVITEVLPQKKSLEYCLEQDTNVTWDQVGGMADTIREIRNAVELPHLNPKQYQQYGLRPPKGFLLYGPPGCGKTYVVKALVNHMFTETKKKGELPAMVIFWDEAESLLSTRGSGISLSGGGTMSDTIVPQVLSLLDGTENLNRKKRKIPPHNGNPCFFTIRGPEVLNMFVGNTEEKIRSIYQTAGTYANGKPLITILATNRPDKLDPAVTRPGRIDLKIKIPRPDKEAGAEIFGIHFKEGIPIDPFLVKQHGSYENARQYLIEKSNSTIYEGSPVAFAVMKSGKQEALKPTDFVSGAKIEGIVNRASTRAFLRDLDKEEISGISLDDFESAIMESLDADINLLMEGNDNDRRKWDLIFGEEARDMRKIVRIKEAQKSHKSSIV